MRQNISIRHSPLQMAEITQPDEIPANSSAGHLSVYVEGAHPPDVPFLFERQPQRLGPAFAVAFAWHVAMVAMLFLAVRYGGPPTSAAFLPEEPNSNIIWLNQPGPGGGGGGGGNKMKEPPRQAELPGKDKITVPVEKPLKLKAPQQAKVEPNPIEQLNIPAKMLAAAQDSLPGAIEAPPGPPTVSQGSGGGGGAGTGQGSGIGPGSGSGLGPGSGGGTGGGVYRAGSGVTNPVPISSPKPAFTSDAMRAKVQGIATVECIVETDGQPSNCHIVRSLDRAFGLDEEAMKAARQWRFRPGMLRGEPVRVSVFIEMQFTLR